MKLKEYIQQLQELVDTNPEAADLIVVYSKDDEGNEFQVVNWTATLGHFKGKYRGAFISETGIKEDEDLEEGDYPINAVCIN
jgi:hypothetical protein